MADIMKQINKHRPLSKISDKSWRVTCACLLRIRFEEKGGSDLFALVKAASKHQGWELPKDKKSFGSHSFFTYSKDWESVEDCDLPPVSPISHVAECS
jgi:hypothetical protein